MTRTIELLAPAKNLECGMAAIDHGADAVYMGAPQFGARAAAGNSLADIATLCRYAHQFAAKVYVTVNTIVYENELEQLRATLVSLAEIGVDAILVQDMTVLETDSKTGKGVNQFPQAVRTALKDKLAEYAAKGQGSRPLRIMVVGRPVRLGRVMPTPSRSTQTSSSAPMVLARPVGMLSLYPPSRNFTPSICRARNAGKQAAEAIR